MDKLLEIKERLMGIVGSIANLYQELMYLEKEGQLDSLAYKENIKKLKLALIYEDKLVKTIPPLEIDKIVDLFSFSNTENVKNMFKFSNIFQIEVRLKNIFLNRYFEETDSTYFYQEKIAFIVENRILLSFLQMINQKIKGNYYKENFCSLKYNIAFSYPFLESQLLEGNIEHLTNTNATLRYSFCYGLDIKKVENQANFMTSIFCGSLIKETKEYANREKDIYYEILLLAIKASLLDVNPTTLGFMEYNFLDEEKEKENSLKDFIHSIFEEVKDINLCRSKTPAFSKNSFFNMEKEEKKSM